MTTLADNGLHIRPRVHNRSTTITIKVHNHTHRSPNFQSPSPALAAPIIGRTGLAEPRPVWPGEREEESVRVLCVARTSLRYVFNTPIQVFNLFGNKRDTFKISMHKTVRITSVECQRHHYILYKTIGGDLIFHLRCIPRDKCANNCAQ